MCSAVAVTSGELANVLLSREIPGKTRKSRKCRGGESLMTCEWRTIVRRPVAEWEDRWGIGGSGGE